MKQLVPIGILLMLCYTSKSQDTIPDMSDTVVLQEVRFQADDTTNLQIDTSSFIQPVIVRDTTAFYACYVGTIGQSPITLNLHKAGKEYAGYYYDNLLQYPVYFSGYETETDSGEAIIYVESVQGINNSDKFYFNLEEDIITGICKRRSGEEVLPFSARIEKTPFDFAYYYSKGRQRLFSSLRDGPKAEFSASSIWPVDENMDFIREFLLKSFNADSSEEVITPVLVKNKKDFFSKYREEFKYTEPAYVIDVEYKFSRDNITDLMVCWYSDRILSLATHRFTYNGGLHGKSSKTYHNYDLVQRRQLTLDDILQPGWDSTVNRLITEKLHASYKLAPYETLKKVDFYHDSISYSDNFFFTSTGIGFSYQPDEIAPYARGQINVFIPFEEMKVVLQPYTVAQLHHNNH